MQRILGLLVCMVLMIASGLVAGQARAQQDGFNSSEAGLVPGKMIPGRTHGDPVSDEPADPTTNPIFLALPPEMQEEILDEAIGFQVECNRKRTYATFHDCECLSLRYLEERLLRGPEASADSIEYHIAHECTNPASIAGFAYGRCFRLYQTTTRPDDLERTCECYANEFAQRYANRPRANNQHQVRIGVQSIQHCRDTSGLIYTPPTLRQRR